MKYVVCFSGGHSSALAAIETVRKYEKENVVLLNHNISSKVEHKDIKRFKQDIADYLDLPITYANMEGWEEKTPCKIMVECGGNSFGLIHCTRKLKTEPFNKWLKEHQEEMTIIYGFDKNEINRIQRRVGVMATMGYKTDYPLALWERTIEKTEDIGILRPSTYRLFRHANCIGCLKSGKQQWYIVYCLYPEIWKEAKQSEKEIGYSILKDTYLEDLENQFYDMKYKKLICPDEKTNPATFWAKVNKTLPGQASILPCECAI